MKFFNTSNKTMSSKNRLTVLIIKIILAITVIQILRALIMGGLWLAVKPGENIVLFQIINGISFITVGLLLLAWFKPSLKDLSLNWDDIRKRSSQIDNFSRPFDTFEDAQIADDPTNG